VLRLPSWRECPAPKMPALWSKAMKPSRHIHSEVHGPAIVSLRAWREPLSVRLDAWLDRHLVFQAFLAGVIVGVGMLLGAWCAWGRP
jgi:hypothetical protein